MDDIIQALELIKKQEAVISVQDEKLLSQDKIISSQIRQIDLLSELNTQLEEKNRILLRQLEESHETGQKLADILDDLFSENVTTEKE